MIVRSHNEWGRLRSVVVGRADNARVPAEDVSLRAVSYAGSASRTILPGPYPRHIIDEANEDLEYLCDVLSAAGVTVIPVPMRHARTLGGAMHCVALDLQRD